MSYDREDPDPRSVEVIVLLALLGWDVVALIVFLVAWLIP